MSSANKSDTGEEQTFVCGVEGCNWSAKKRSSRAHHERFCRLGFGRQPHRRAIDKKLAGNSDEENLADWQALLAMSPPQQQNVQQTQAQQLHQQQQPQQQQQGQQGQQQQQGDRNRAPPTTEHAAVTAPLQAPPAQPSRQTTFPYPTDASQPRRHFTAGAGVGTFTDPTTGRANTALIYEHSALLYPTPRHHHIRVTSLQLAGIDTNNENITATTVTYFRAALFLMPQPSTLTFDVRAPPPSDPERFVYADLKARLEYAWMRKEAGEAWVGMRGGQTGRGGGPGAGGGGIVVEPAERAEEGGEGDGEGEGEVKGEGDGEVVEEEIRFINGIRVADGRDNDNIPYSVGLPEFAQRLAVVGPMGRSLDEAVEGLKRVLESCVVEKLVNG
ncbi:hypothetical protein UCDDS831_g04235 [Diplodia seriata]|uniref:Uncharacterized protein n=1 Tax=Diplodia seriata TaxID=420778 RepID=A0A0G2EG45_9PEZI|nr:hypothetical protein UCDDS831_g04235 [Diplodia seriata]